MPEGPIDAGGRLVNWFKHAFATDPPGPARPTDAQRLVVETLCVEVVRRRLTTPALLALEMSRPLNYLSAQLLHFFQPLLVVLGDTAAYDRFTEFLQQRGSIEYIVERLEALEASDAARAGGPAGTTRPS
jgi:uracil-DNA glycosylase